MTTHSNDIHYATVTPVPIAPNVASAVANATLTQPPPSTTHLKINANPVHHVDIDNEQRKRLIDQGYSNGLVSSLNDLQNSFPLRIWVIDNSGSMGTIDGHRFIPSKDSADIRMISCTRWEEIQDCVKYHVRLSALIKAPTNFRLLNNPGLGPGSQEFNIGIQSESMIQNDVSNAMNIMSRVRPSGLTPLTDHIREIHTIISSMQSSLQAQGNRVVVVLATDGLPTNEFAETTDYVKEEFVQSLRSLEGLPVWLVIRLSTDEEEVVDFYNSLDDQLELSMDVLDDFCGEAKEIYEHNDWLNYGLPLHRLREMGFHDRVLDMIDERPLTKSEIRNFCLLLFGIEKCDGLPDPSIDWNGFMNMLKQLLSQEELQWDPMKQKPMPWIDLRKLDKRYGEKASVGCVCAIM